MRPRFDFLEEREPPSSPDECERELAPPETSAACFIPWMVVLCWAWQPFPAAVLEVESFFCWFVTNPLPEPDCMEAEEEEEADAEGPRGVAALGAAPLATDGSSRFWSDPQRRELRADLLPRAQR